MRSREVAREKAIERSQDAYFMLECGHLTDWHETQLNEAFRLLETVLGPMWYACSACFWDGKLDYWQKRMPKPKIVYPAQPLF